MSNKERSPFVMLLVTLVVGNLFGSTPKTKTYRTQQDFQSGEASGVSISHQGEISLAPKLDEVYDTPLAFIWSAVMDSHGNIFVAGGNDGEVYRIGPKGKKERVFKAPEPQIYALAIDKKDNLFIGSSPEGKVYKLSGGKAGQADESVFFEPGELYIWSMVIDKQGELLVATGENGKIFKVNRAGSGAVFYEFDDKQIVRIVPGRAGGLIAGTADKGIVLRIDDAGKAFVLYDAPLVEITDLYEDVNGVIYAAATGGSRLSRRAPPRPASPQNGDAGKDGGSTPAEDEELDFHQNAAPLQAARRGGQQGGALYRIEVDGTVSTYQSPQSERIYCIASDGQGNLLLGTGEDGKIYRMSPAGDYTLLADLEEVQVTKLLTDKHGKTYVATSNSAKLYTLGKQYRKQGEFTTKAYDAGVVSQWGEVSWEAALASDTKVVIQTRSGNAEEPDKTWSDWSKNYTSAAGTVIQSPSARYLQLRATLTSNDGRNLPSLKKVSFSHLQKNVAPKINQIRIHTPGEYYPVSMGNSQHNSHLINGEQERKNGFQNQSLGRKSTRKGYRSVSWLTQDNNGDDLSFDLYYKRVQDKSWKELVVDYSGNVYSWDSELIPDGRYVIKLEASDGPSNPPARVLSSEKISREFVVDNSGPDVNGFQVQVENGKTTITFSARDNWSNIKRVDYGVNADQWNLLYPIDGICDSRSEKFKLMLDVSLVGETAIVIKVQDELGNIGFGNTIINVK